MAFFLGTISNKLHGYTHRGKGKELFDILVGKSLYLGTTDTITAHAGGTQAAATALNYGFNRVSVCATLNDSVQLPPAVQGAVVIVANDGAAAGKVYPNYAGGTPVDKIDGASATTGATLTNAKRAIFIAPSDGNWTSLGTGESA